MARRVSDWGGAGLRAGMRTYPWVGVSMAPALVIPSWTLCAEDRRVDGAGPWKPTVSGSSGLVLTRGAVWVISSSCVVLVVVVCGCGCVRRRCVLVPVAVAGGVAVVAVRVVFRLRSRLDPGRAPDRSHTRTLWYHR